MNLDNLTKFARLLVSLKAFRVYSLKGSKKFGGFLWNWFNPISWVLAPVGLILHGLIEGFPDAWRYRHEIGLGINPWYKDKEIEWL